MALGLCSGYEKPSLGLPAQSPIRSDGACLAKTAKSSLGVLGFIFDFGASITLALCVIFEFEYSDFRHSSALFANSSSQNNASVELVISKFALHPCICDVWSQIAFNSLSAVRLASFEIDLIVPKISHLSGITFGALPLII
jgi:hypothetical protein